MVKEGKKTTMLATASNRKSQGIDHAFYLEDYMNNFQARYSRFIDSIGYIMIPPIVVSFLGFMFSGVGWWLLLNIFDITPWICLLLYKYHLLVVMDKIRRDIASHPIWRIKWNLRGRYEDEAKILGLKMFQNREMARCFDILSIDKIAVNRADFERVLKKDGVDPEHQLDTALLGEYLDQHYLADGQPNIVNEEHGQGLIEYEYEHAVELVPTGRMVYKSAAELLEMEREGKDVTDPKITMKPEMVARTTKNLTGRYWKKVNGKYLDPEKPEEWSIEDEVKGEDVMNVYRVRLGMHLVLREKQAIPGVDREKIDVTTIFIQMLGTKEQNIRYEDGLIPRNGFPFDTSLFCDMHIRIEQFTQRGFLITTNTWNPGIDELEMPAIAKGAKTTEDTIIQVQAAALLDDEVVINNKEKHYAETDRKIQDGDETDAHDAFVNLGNSDTGNIVKKAADSYLPKDKEIRQLWWRTTVALMIFAFIGGMGVLALIFTLVRLI